MPLPILHVSSAATPADIVRLFHQTERDYVRQTSEETALDFGTAFHNASLPRVYDANCILDAALSDELSPADTLAQAQEHFAQAGAPLWRWVMNPSSASDRTEPLVQHLLANAYQKQTADVMRLASNPPTPRSAPGDLKIIPSRASFRHARALAEEASTRWNEPQLADAAMQRLDDPHWDSLIALRDGRAVAHVAVLAVGEVGRIDDVFVAEGFRRQGIGRTMLDRALEICARSLFKHVLLCVAHDNVPAQSLYSSLNFKKIGEIVSYNRNG